VRIDSPSSAQGSVSWREARAGAKRAHNKNSRLADLTSFLTPCEFSILDSRFSILDSRFSILELGNLTDGRHGSFCDVGCGVAANP